RSPARDGTKSCPSCGTAMNPAEVILGTMCGACVRKRHAAAVRRPVKRAWESRTLQADTLIAETLRHERRLLQDGFFSRFDPHEHPRGGKGTQAGGKFVKKLAASMALALALGGAAEPAMAAGPSVMPPAAQTQVVKAAASPSAAVSNPTAMKASVD